MTESSGLDDGNERWETIRDQVDDLAVTAEELRRAGSERGVPAIERNAARIEAIVEILDRNVPPEVVDDRE